MPVPIWTSTSKTAAIGAAQTQKLTLHPTETRCPNLFPLSWTIHCPCPNHISKHVSPRCSAGHRGSIGDWHGLSSNTSKRNWGTQKDSKDLRLCNYAWDFTTSDFAWHFWKKGLVIEDSQLRNWARLRREHSLISQESKLRNFTTSDCAQDLFGLRMNHPDGGGPRPISSNLPRQNGPDWGWTPVHRHVQLA